MPLSVEQKVVFCYKIVVQEVKKLAKKMDIAKKIEKIMMEKKCSIHLLNGIRYLMKNKLKSI